MANNYNNQQQTTSKTNKQQPTPILKTKMVHPNTYSNTANSTLRNSASSNTSSRKRAHSSSVEFSQEISIMERKATIDSQEVIESGKLFIISWCTVMFVQMFLYKTTAVQ